MFNKLKFLFVGLLFFLTTFPAYSDDLMSSDMFDTKNAERIILVAFKDNSINRIPSTANAYRKRGDYDSTTWSVGVSEQIEKDYHVKKLTEWPMTEVDVHCVVYQVPTDLSVADTVKILSQDMRVDVVQNLNTFTTKTDKNSDPYSKLQSNLQEMQIDKIHVKATGKNVAIAMIDTGVDLTHPDLEGQISRNENYAQMISKDFNSDKHGTAIAGIIIAKKNNGLGIVGVAPDANLIALKACWSVQTDSMEAVCNSFTLALAINNAIKSGVKILNMSLTGPQDPILELLLNKAISKGMIIVAANTGSGKLSENFPANLPQVISVQSLTNKNTPALQNSLAISGEKILTTLPHATYDFISGSSMSTAEVSGIIALLLELNPDLTFAEIQTLLKSNSTAQNGINAKLAVCSLTNCANDLLSLAEQ
jgi:subtilisin family serine protease